VGYSDLPLRREGWTDLGGGMRRSRLWNGDAAEEKWGEMKNNTIKVPVHRKEGGKNRKLERNRTKG